MMKVLSGVIAGLWSQLGVAQTFDTKTAAIAYLESLLAASGTTYRLSYNANGGTGRISISPMILLPTLRFSRGTVFMKITEPTGSIMKKEKGGTGP